MPVLYTDYTRRLQRLLEVCKNLSGNMDFQPLLDSIIEVASELTLSESSSILVYDSENRYLRFQSAPFYVIEKVKQVKVPLDNSIAGWVFSHCQPMLLHHADEDARIFRVVDRELADNTHSIVAVPICYHGETLGVIESVNKCNGEHYTEEDVSILEILAAQIGIVLQNQYLVDAKEQALQKVEALDHLKKSFIAIASHELRTPLGLILGHASFLSDTAREEQRPDLDVIVSSAIRLKEVLEDLSNVDGLEQGNGGLSRGRVVIQLLVQEVVDSLKEIAAQRKISLTVDIAQGNLIVDGDDEKIATALRNLVKNALVFTNEGGWVKVKAELLPGYVKITVQDSGIGIPAAEQEKIFQRFYQVEKHLTRRHGGLGLGLSIAKDMIELHGGRIWVESKEGQGSRFIFLLPINADQVRAAQKVFIT